MGKSTISMAIFHCYVSSPVGTTWQLCHLGLRKHHCCRCLVSRSLHRPPVAPLNLVSSLNLTGFFGPKARFPADSSKICYGRVLIVGFKSPYSWDSSRQWCKVGRLGPKSLMIFSKWIKLAACTQSLSAMCNPTTWLDLTFDTARIEQWSHSHVENY